MTAPTSPAAPRALLADLFWSAVTAAAPGPALAAALASDSPKLKRRVQLIALGKAAHPMAAAAVSLLRQRGGEPAGGIIVSPLAEDPPHPSLVVVAGDHPEPAQRSLGAAAQLGAIAGRVRPEDEVWVLLSGGATSLLGAPISGVTPEELSSLYRLLLGSGLDITAMNRIRKRFSRWGAGRLAAALAPARVKNFTISDVIGDDLASIGSGPCVPDTSTAGEVRMDLTSAGLWERIPEAMRRLLAAVERGELPETPKPGNPAFDNMEVRVVASNSLALEAVAARARVLGCTPLVLDSALAGEAAHVGERVAQVLLSYADLKKVQPEMHKNASCLIWGGETTVRLGEAPTGQGGRNQELALAAARSLAGAPTGHGAVTLLAAGTDGRDGPTDAAGAIVDGETWEKIRRAGRDPDRDLAQHNSFPALASADALLHTGLTGTNVMDVVIGVVGRPEAMHSNSEP